VVWCSQKMEIEEEKVELNSDDGNWEQYADMV
jgi:hypothetical protein